VLFCFDNAYRLAYRIPRKLGEIRIVADKSSFIVEENLGLINWVKKKTLAFQ
jgi:hypothetical protein